MQKLCNIMHIAIISDIALKGTLDRIIINLHLSFGISNIISTYILDGDWIKFQFISFVDNVGFLPLNELYIQGLTKYTRLL